jgi:cytochrome c biogenesis protein CcdA
MKIMKYMLMTFIFFVVAAVSSVMAQTQPPIYFFYGTGCPHCAEVMNYFEDNGIFNKYPVDKREIYFNKDNALLFNKVMDELGVAAIARGVPTVVMGKKVITGDRPIMDEFAKEADMFLSGTPIPTVASPIPTAVLTQVVAMTPVPQPEEMPSAAGQEIKKADLTIAAVVAGSLVDAINPCEFAVLIILMTTILASGNAGKALRAGLAFSLSIFISYFLMGLGLYKALSLGGVAGGFFKIIGWLAILLGILNLKDYFWYGKGVLMEVPLSWRPQLKGLIRSVTGPAGAFAIGFLVSLFLLPCTSGPYIVILGMLARRVLDVRAILYLVLYNLIFVSPMVIISFAVYRGFDPTKAEEIRQKRLRMLHLIAGVVMVGMGLVIVGGWI